MSTATSSPTTERAEVEEKLTTLKTELEGEDLDAIRGATEALMNASQQFSQRLYEQASAEASPGGADESTDAGDSSDDDIVDAEIVEDED